MFAIKTTARKLRLGRVRTWSTPYLNVKYNYFFLLYTLSIYLKGIFNSLDLSLWFFNQETIDEADKTTTPVLLGNVKFIFKQSQLYIYLYYYLDITLYKEFSLSSLLLRLKIAEGSLRSILGCAVVLIHFNYFYYLYQPLLNVNVMRTYNRKMSTIFYRDYTRLRHMFGFFNLKRLYLRVRHRLKFFRRNQYFTRIFNVSFCVFSFISFDITLLLSIIKYEFQNLLKKHSLFIRFLKSLFNSLFIAFSSKSGLRGLSLIIKGRLVPVNRQSPRSVKKIIACGCLDLSNINQFVDAESTVAVSRFGTINLTLTVQHYIINRQRSEQELNRLVPKLSYFESFLDSLSVYTSSVSIINFLQLFTEPMLLIQYDYIKFSSRSSSFSKRLSNLSIRRKLLGLVSCISRYRSSILEGIKRRCDQRVLLGLYFINNYYNIDLYISRVQFKTRQYISFMVFILLIKSRNIQKSLVYFNLMNYYSSRSPLYIMYFYKTIISLQWFRLLFSSLFSKVLAKKSRFSTYKFKPLFRRIFKEFEGSFNASKGIFNYMFLRRLNNSGLKLKLRYFYVFYNLYTYLQFILYSLINVFKYFSIDSTEWYQHNKILVIFFFYIEIIRYNYIISNSFMGSSEKLKVNQPMRAYSWYRSNHNALLYKFTKKD